MNIKFFDNSSLYVKLLIIILFVSFIPTVVLGVYHIATHQSFSQYFIYTILSSTVLVVLLSIFAASFLNKLITEPINHFIKSATEIARGELSKKVPVASKNELGRLAWLFNYMVEDLRRAKDVHKVSERLIEKEKIETILKSTADGVILTDSQNSLLLINPAVEKWFKLKNSEVENQSIKDTLKHQSFIDFICAFSKDHSKNHENYEIILKDENIGTEKVLQVKTVKVKNKQTGELNSVVTVLRDITREKEIDRLKTELVSMVAHELRSPLTCISGFSELLLDDTVTKDQSAEYASIILKEANRLNDLINKFLDISKIESGKSQLNRTPVDLKMLVEKVLDFNSQLADRKKINVIFNSPAQVPIIEVDRDMLEQAVLNLFSNAVKYSPEKAAITVDLHERDDYLLIDIKDTGFGISQKSLPHIFEKFYRVTDNEKIVDITGSGLGLPLVKEIIDIHEGKITVESELGKGSIFSISLPKNVVLSENDTTERVMSLN